MQLSASGWRRLLLAAPLSRRSRSTVDVLCGWRPDPDCWLIPPPFLFSFVVIIRSHGFFFSLSFRSIYMVFLATSSSRSVFLPFMFCSFQQTLCVAHCWSCLLSLEATQRVAQRHLASKLSMKDPRWNWETAFLVAGQTTLGCQEAVSQASLTPS